MLLAVRIESHNRDMHLLFIRDIANFLNLFWERRMWKRVRAKMNHEVFIDRPYPLILKNYPIWKIL